MLPRALRNARGGLPPFKCPFPYDLSLIFEMSAQAGIGCVLSAACVVQSLKDGGAAACCGLIIPGDRLDAIDGVRVESDAHARPLILGPTGTQVTLSLDRNGTK